MINRKNKSKMIAHLPATWSDDFVEVLSEIYKDELAKHQKRFDAFGIIYDDELTIAISFLNDDISTIPVTYLVSTDVTPETQTNIEQKKTKDYLKIMTDSVGVFFDSYFAGTEEVDYISTWQEINIDGQQLYYKISRENIGLSLKAQELLQQDN